MVQRDTFKLGLGNDRRRDGSNDEDCKREVSRAINEGYRHIDTAQIYGNESEIGEAIRSSNVDREDLFLATKLHSDYLAYDDVFECVDERLEELGLDIIDLVYVHWPFDPYDPEETMKALNELRSEGKIRHIGLSNFTLDMVDEARKYADEIFAIQVEMHPFLPQSEIVDYAQRNDIWAVAHTPLARGEALELSEVVEVAERQDITPAQAVLAWLINKDNVAAIPKASGNHIAENLQSLSVELEDKDMQKIESIEESKRIVDPDIAPWNQ